MSQFDSPLGSKKFGNSNLREFDVPDESQPMHNERHRPNFDAIQEFQARLEQDNDEDFRMQEVARKEQEFRMARESKKTGKERLNDGAKRRIEMLLGMSRLTRTFELDNNSYVLQTLRDKDMREVFVETAKFDGTVESPYEMRKQLIARALIQIAGYDIEMFLGSNSLETRLAFVEELPEALLARIFNEYQLLVKESTEKYAIKSDADAKEVVEDLKK